MVKIFACLAGSWVCLTDDPNCTIGECVQSPYDWWKEGADIWAPHSRLENDQEHNYYFLDYVHIIYKGDRWRINPTFIQIVNG